MPDHIWTVAHDGDPASLTLSARDLLSSYHQT